MVRLLPLAVAAFALILVGLTSARTLPKRSKQVKVYSYVLPAGAEEIRDDINHSFACGNRTDGFYVDIDNDCQIFHRCQDHARFSFICAERTVFSQMYQTCVHDGQLGYPCEESAQYYPEGEGYEPSASGSEAAEEAPQVEEMQPEQQAVPAQELEAPQAPSKAVETVAPSEDIATGPETSAQDNVQQPSEQAETEVEVNDEPEQQQEEEVHHQVNADLFDPIEEDESEVPSENSAQEVMDEGEPSSPATVSSEASSSDPATTQEEESNEVEVMDDAIPQQQEEQTEEEQHTEQEQPTEQESFVSSEPSPSVELSDATAQEEVVEAEQAVNTEQETQTAPNDSPTPVAAALDNEPQYQADSLLNAVQMVEELEPIVHDLAVETDDLKPLVAEIAQDLAPAPTQEDNELLPESGTSATLADMEAPQKSSDASSMPSDSEPTVAALESDAVNELLPEMVVSSGAPSDDSSSSDTIDTISVEADETAQPAGEPETVQDTEQAESEAHSPQEQTMPAAGDEQERPMESPAIVEEMAPLRPNDSAELPELIVSTEFHLDAVTQGPPIRRRKTFLFRADAIRSRH